MLSNSASDAATDSIPHDAGFWKRAAAFLIDFVIVASTVSAVSMLLVTAFPSVGRFITLKTPFGIGTVERVIDEKTSEQADTDGNKLIKFEKILERDVLKRWVYRYRVEGQKTEYTGDTFVTSVRTSLTWQIDPATGEPIDSVDLDHIVLITLLLYWVAADASRAQGSLGKRLLGLQVGDSDGKRLTLARAAGRNALKAVSFAILLIGFLMAGWTRRKQALHDWLTGSYVIAAP